MVPMPTTLSGIVWPGPRILGLREFLKANTAFAVSLPYTPSTASLKPSVCSAVWIRLTASSVPGLVGGLPA